MSEGKDGAETAPVVDKSQEVTVAPVVDDDKGVVAKPSAATLNEDETVPNRDLVLDPVMSYEPGIDLIEPVISEGETRYEGKAKGKSRAESFSHLPTPGDTAPSTAPSTRQTSESAPTTAPSTRPVSDSQAGPQSTTAKGTLSVSKGEGNSVAVTAQKDLGANTRQDDPVPVPEQDDPAASATQSESAPITDQGDPASISDQGESAADVAQDTLPLKNKQTKYSCGCLDIYDNTGKKRQQACNEHKINPNRAVLTLPPKRPLDKTTNLHTGTRRGSIYIPQAQRTEDSPPPQPPVLTPTKGRNFVQGSENSPAFLDPFNSERAIEPTGPPGTLTTVQAEDDSVLRVIQEAGGLPRPHVSDPNASNSGSSRDAPNPPQGGEGTGGSQATQPQVQDETEGLGSGSKASSDEQLEGEEAAAGPKQGEGSDGEDGDEHRQPFKGRESSDTIIVQKSKPTHRYPRPQPKPILKKPSPEPSGTMPEASGTKKWWKLRSRSKQVSNGDESEDGTQKWWKRRSRSKQVSDIDETELDTVVPNQSEDNIAGPNQSEDNIANPNQSVESIAGPSQSDDNVAGANLFQESARRLRDNTAAAGSTSTLGRKERNRVQISTKANELSDEPGSKSGRVRKKPVQVSGASNDPGEASGTRNEPGEASGARKKPGEASGARNEPHVEPWFTPFPDAPKNLPEASDNLPDAPHDDNQRDAPRDDNQRPRTKKRGCVARCVSM